MKAACAPPRSRPPPSSSSHLLPSHRHRAHPAGLGTQRFGELGAPQPGSAASGHPKGLPKTFPGWGQEGAGGRTEEGEPAEQRGGHPGFWGTEVPGGLSTTHTFRARSCPLSFPLRLQAEAPKSCRCQQQKNA